jgi:beta-lactamase regulating signal transducer with metallopeptidase domain
MVAEIFYWVLNMSILGSLAGLIILLLRRIKRIPRFCVYCLWLAPLLRFWLPLSVSARYSLMSLISRFATKTVVIYGSFEAPSVVMTNSIMAAKSYFPIVYKTNMLESAFNISGFVWIVVFCALLITTILLYYFTKSEVRNAVHVSGNVYRCAQVTSPAVYGVLRPRIIIPENVPEETLRYILLHENVHLKRKDNLLRCIVVVTACLHWFNPLAWLFLKYAFEDMELACDAKVLKPLGGSGKKEYAMALLNYASNKSLYVSAFGAPRTRVRIENILSYKKLTLVSSMFFFALTAAVIVLLVMNSQS